LLLAVRWTGGADMLGRSFRKCLAAFVIHPKKKNHTAMMVGIAAIIVFVVSVPPILWPKARNSQESNSGQHAPPQTSPAPTSAKSPQQRMHPEVKYFAKKSRNTLLPNVLMATANGKAYELIGKSKQKCLRLIAQKDFDDNGSLDALVEHITAC